MSLMYVHKQHGGIVYFPTPLDLENYHAMPEQEISSIHNKVYNAEKQIFEDKVPTDVELREAFKAERDKFIAGSTVQYQGMVFDSDEVSQNRMLRPIAILQHKPVGTTQLWILNDNSVVYLDINQFLAVLELAGAQQTEAWVQV